MYVRHLSVGDFRSWATAELPLEPGPSVLIGANGQGKTNLIEAIGYLSTLGSHRVALDAPLLRVADGVSASVAHVRGAVVSDGRELLLEVDIAAGKANRARVNRAGVRSPRELLGILRTVLFAPEDLAIVRGDPSERRAFLDNLLVQMRPSLAGVRADYDRVLRQRGALLKSAAPGRRGSGRGSGSGVGVGVGAGAGADAGSAGALSTLDVWDANLAALGAQLLAARLTVVHGLRPFVEEAYAQVAADGAAMSGKSSSATASIAYLSSLGDALPGSAAELAAGGPAVIQALETAMLSELARRRPQEIERGINLVGPHRDDLELRLAGLPVKGYASHGESWSVALALRLGSFGLMNDDGASPVLLLDDVFAELDLQRRDRLAALVQSAEQVVVTAAVPDDVPSGLFGAKYTVSGGVVQRAE